MISRSLPSGGRSRAGCHARARRVVAIRARQYLATSSRGLGSGSIVIRTIRCGRRRPRYGHPIDRLPGRSAAAAVLRPFEQVKCRQIPWWRGHRCTPPRWSRDASRVSCLSLLPIFSRDDGAVYEESLMARGRGPFLAVLGALGPPGGTASTPARLRRLGSSREIVSLMALGARQTEVAMACWYFARCSSSARRRLALSGLGPVYAGFLQSGPGIALYSPTFEPSRAGDCLSSSSSAWGRRSGRRGARGIRCRARHDDRRNHVARNSSRIYAAISVR